MSNASEGNVVGVSVHARREFASFTVCAVIVCLGCADDANQAGIDQARQPATPLFVKSDTRLDQTPVVAVRLNERFLVNEAPEGRQYRHGWEVRARSEITDDATLEEIRSVLRNPVNFADIPYGDVMVDVPPDMALTFGAGTDAIDVIIYLYGAVQVFAFDSESADGVTGASDGACLSKHGMDQLRTVFDKLFPPDSLNDAVERGNVVAVKQFLKSKNVEIDGKHATDSPLVNAIVNDETEIARLLIENGADIHSKDPHDFTTPLHWASGAFLPEIVELLIDQGADVNAFSTTFGTPLDNAIGTTITGRSGERAETIAILRKRGGSSTVYDPAPISVTPIILVAALAVLAGLVAVLLRRFKLDT